MSQILRQVAVCFCPSIALVLCSCGSQTAKIPVTGTVTWNDEAIPQGDILLIPEGDAQNPDPGKIVNGQYTVETTPGPKVVHIFYSREKPGPVSVMNQKEREQVIPAEYNHASRLKIVVSAENKEFSFHLPEKAKEKQ
jgi:hypothetical protein